MAIPSKSALAQQQLAEHSFCGGLVQIQTVNVTIHMQYLVAMK